MGQYGKWKCIIYTLFFPSLSLSLSDFLLALHFPLHSDFKYPSPSLTPSRHYNPNLHGDDSLRIWGFSNAVFVEIRDVYADNLDEEFKLIAETIDKYPLIGLDAEYLGVPVPAAGSTKYEKLKINVDSTKLIQVGLTLLDDKVNLPPHGIVWQFNFREFNPASSVELLRDSGIDFAANMEKGVDAARFGELLMSSGNGNVALVTFQGSWSRFGAAGGCPGRWRSSWGW
ncbi:probable CCR4-associated factor 1 homolog 10 [Salvia splendens]|uniref:probable CCR4-associated factor 1 homolog 10 n=1 Tax=Salvia splendens TaxID=180675 RepID=UPI001C268A7E|nr:probable CCR4-associated factor 1 homolog 10 [Salvia splendens]